MNLEQGLSEFHKRLVLALQRNGQPAADAGLVASKVSDLLRLAVKSQQAAASSKDHQPLNSDKLPHRKD